MKKPVYIILTLVLLVSCSFFKRVDETDAIARVNETYLYKSDIKDIVPVNTSAEDSTLIVNAFINRWATQLLLMDGALQNLPERKQIEFSKLIDQYKNDLYTKAYLDALVKKSIDTIVGTSEAQKFYEANKESFKLNDDLIQFRYINIAKNSIDLDTIKNRFKRYKEKDKRYLDSISVQFKSYLLNDSIWIKLNQVTEKLPVITIENKDQLLKKSNFIELEDSINLYLMQVKDVRFQNNYAPLEHVKRSIEKIVINKRKLELIKQLENDITKDAVKNKEFEIFK